MMEFSLPSLWNAYWKILALSTAPFEAVKHSKHGLWFALQLFLMVALVANLGQLVMVAESTQQVTFVEILHVGSMRIREVAEPFPLLFEKPLNAVADKIDEFTEGLKEFQPPLGTRTSQLVRALGEWLSGPLQLLGAWMGGSLTILLVARFMGSTGGMRVHMSLLLLAIAPQAFYPLVDFLTNSFFSGLSMGYVNWALRLGLGAWSVILLTIALATAHNIRRDRAVAVLLVSALVFLLLIPLLFVSLLGLLLWLVF